MSSTRRSLNKRGGSSGGVFWIVEKALDQGANQTLIKQDKTFGQVEGNKAWLLPSGPFLIVKYWKKFRSRNKKKTKKVD